MVYQRQSTRSRNRFSKLLRPVPLAIAGVVLLILIVLALELTNTTYIFHKKKATSSTIPATIPTSDSTDSSAASADNDSSDGADTPSTKTPTPTSPKAPGPSGSTEPPRVPSGNFVSNHRPSLSNTEDAPSSVQSVCNTSPGATCTITFTSKGVTKTLESKTANSEGLVVWNWDIVKAGFVEGSWQITATATLNGQTKTAQDSQAMEVAS